MQVSAPTSEDIEAIMSELDENFDGVIDKNEFVGLLMLVFGKMLETEETV